MRAALDESSAADTLHARGGAHITNLLMTCYFQLANMQQPANLAHVRSALSLVELAAAQREITHTQGNCCDWKGAAGAQCNMHTVR